jgi:2-oxoglutarate ferredoxin oxidoreductase subunit beta
MAAEERQHLVIHEPHKPGLKAEILAKLSHPEFPTPLGVFRSLIRPSYEELRAQQDGAILKDAKPDLRALLIGNNAWEL